MQKLSSKQMFIISKIYQTSVEVETNESNISKCILHKIYILQDWYLQSLIVHNLISQFRQTLLYQKFNIYTKSNLYL